MLSTIKVKTWGKDQGDFVLINEKDFDPSFHVLYDENENVDEAERPKSTIDNIEPDNIVQTTIETPVVNEPKKRGRKKKCL